jgi:hypothetical protein
MIMKRIADTPFPSILFPAIHRAFMIVDEEAKIDNVTNLLRKYTANKTVCANGQLAGRAHL